MQAPNYMDTVQFIGNDSDFGGYTTGDVYSVMMVGQNYPHAPVIVVIEDATGYYDTWYLEAFHNYFKVL